MDIDHESLYLTELIYLRNGRPVWEPNPDTLYDCVRIGDVGYFQNGKFVPIFNILPPDDSNPNRRLPFPQPDFPPLRIIGNPTHRTNPLAGVYALESRLTFSISGGIESPGSALQGETSLSFTDEKGAALIYRTRPDAKTLLTTTCQLERGTRLVLVTGCDLTRQWATATYFRNNREIALGGGGGVASVASAHFSLSAGWRINQAINTRQGPPEDQEVGETAVGDNQCVFLRGFYVKERFLFGPKVLKAGAGYHDPGEHGPEAEGRKGLLAGDDITVESFAPPTQDESLIVDLLDYMLEESDADIVIAHDSDLWPYLQGIPTRGNLRETLKKVSPHINVENGVGSLVVEGNEVGELNNKISRKRILAAEKSHALQIQDHGVNPNPSSPALQYGKRPYVKGSSRLSEMDTTTLLPPEPQLGGALSGTMKKIKQSCDKFRILILGKEGVGKSSLINHTFKVELPKAEYNAGAANINKEIFSAENDSFVLHYSQAYYGVGDFENWRKLKKFISRRSGNVNLSDRLHAIWLCVETPIAGRHVLEIGDEEVFRVARGKVPIIIVFTRYDNLVYKEERQLLDDRGTRTKGEIHSLVTSIAYQSFENNCLMPMNSSIPCVYVSVNPRYEDTLRNLVKTTLHYVNPAEHLLPQFAPANHLGSSKRPSKSWSSLYLQSSSSTETRPVPIEIDVANSVSIMLTIAQRIDPDANIRASVSIGRKGIESGVHSTEETLDRCLEDIHHNIIFIWNFPKLDMLSDSYFRGRVLKLVEDFAAQGSSPNDNTTQNTMNIAGAAGALTAIAVGTVNPVGFIVGPIIAGGILAKWAYDTYRATPAMLQCLMAYIVDLIVIMKMIFVISDARIDGVVTPEEVENVLDRFETNKCSGIHVEITEFVREMGALKAAGGNDTVFEKMVELIDGCGRKAEDST